MEIINYCRDMLHLNLPSVTLNHRTDSFVKKFVSVTTRLR